MLTDLLKLPYVLHNFLELCLGYKWSLQKVPKNCSNGQGKKIDGSLWLLTVKFSRLAHPHVSNVELV